MKSSDYSHLASFAEAEIRPLRVGRRLWVGPEGASAPEAPDVLPIWLRSGPAFGVGAHPTTQLCLRALDRHLPPRARVLDIGTGTGILALAAARLNAQCVYALDIDPHALEVARANVLLNGVGDRVRVEVGGLADVVQAHEDRFTWVMANILAHVLIDLLDQGLAALVAPGGWLVLSGFLRSQAHIVRAAIRAAGLELLAQEQQDDWICILAHQPARR